MFDGLDAPTVLRVGDPTMGRAVLALDYRPAAPALPLPLEDFPATPLVDGGRILIHLLSDDVTALYTRMAYLEARVTALETPWYRRCWTALRGWRA